MNLSQQHEPWRAPEAVRDDNATGRFKWYGRLRTLMLAGAFVWPLLGFVSLFAFDAPGSEKDIWVWAIVAPIWAYPFIAFICSAIASILKRKGNARGATILMGVPAAMAGTFFALVLAAIAYGTIVG